jgi:hypothetical protein
MILIYTDAYECSIPIAMSSSIAIAIAIAFNLLFCMHVLGLPLSRARPLLEDLAGTLGGFHVGSIGGKNASRGGFMTTRLSIELPRHHRRWCNNTPRAPDLRRRDAATANGE